MIGFLDYLYDWQLVRLFTNVCGWHRLLNIIFRFETMIAFVLGQTQLHAQSVSVYSISWF